MSQEHSAPHMGIRDPQGFLHRQNRKGQRSQVGFGGERSWQRRWMETPRGGSSITLSTNRPRIPLRPNPSGLCGLPGMKTFPHLPPPGLILLRLAGARSPWFSLPPVARRRSHAAFLQTYRVAEISLSCFVLFSLGRSVGLPELGKNDKVARKGGGNNNNNKNKHSQPTQLRQTHL